MGRQDGVNGTRLTEDISTGNWRTFRYETSSKMASEINQNWFAIKEFVELVDQN